MGCPGNPRQIGVWPPLSTEQHAKVIESGELPEGHNYLIRCRECKKDFKAKSLNVAQANFAKHKGGSK